MDYFKELRSDENDSLFDKTNMLYKYNLPIIYNRTLFALTLLIAERKPKEI